MKETVESVYIRGNCCSCGLCIGTCPKKCISYKIDNSGFFKIEVDNNLCINCGICLDCCPGNQYYLAENSHQTNKYFYGYSNDNYLRLNASSGGMLTEFLKYLLNYNVVDYVNIITNKKNDSSPKPILTNNVKTIEENKGSKYCPVKIGELIKQLDGVSGNVAILALPCQIFGLKKYYEKRNTDINILLYISLFCNHVPSFSATEYLLYTKKIKNYKNIYYRGGGWPGFFKIDTDKKVYKYPYRKTVAEGFGKYFKALRCEICDDPFGELADISFADAYFLSEKENEQGYTFALSRNETVNSYLKEMSKNGFIKLIEGPDEPAVKKAFNSLYNRKKDAYKKRKLLKKLGKIPPKSVKKNEETSLSIKKKIMFLRGRFLVIIARKKIFWPFLYKIKK